jgi:hypothetical protein
MGKMKGLYSLRFFLFLCLVPSLMFGIIVDFSRNQESDFLSSAAVSGGETSEVGGIALFVSEDLLLCSRTLGQSRTYSNRFWRQVLALILFTMMLKTLRGVTFQEYCFHNCSIRKFFNILVNSLLLGGRAPPLPVY